MRAAIQYQNKKDATKIECVFVEIEDAFNAPRDLAGYVAVFYDLNSNQLFRTEWFSTVKGAIDSYMRQHCGYDLVYSISWDHIRDAEF